MPRRESPDRDRKELKSRKHLDSTQNPSLKKVPSYHFPPSQSSSNPFPTLDPQTTPSTSPASRVDDTIQPASHPSSSNLSSVHLSTSSHSSTSSSSSSSSSHHQRPHFHPRTTEQHDHNPPQPRSTAPPPDLPPNLSFKRRTSRATPTYKNPRERAARCTPLGDPHPHPHQHPHTPFRSARSQPPAPHPPSRMRKPRVRGQSPVHLKHKKPLKAPRPHSSDTTCAGQTA